MTVKDFLQICSLNDYIGLYDMDCPATKKNKSSRRFEVFPTQQTYMKIGNIPYERLRNILDEEIMQINHTAKGYLVRFYDKRRLDSWMDNHNLAIEISKKEQESKE